MQKTKIKVAKVSLTLQVSPEFAKELNAAVATVTPRASRSSVMQTAIREWMERNRRPRPKRRKRQETQS